ncbi:hypothetical protein FSP39_024195 [Pinctada imbricata]|uniref:B box-type domain-containing protein n=1 Tax=Pinctada imbricata TaxID=66713 RepID=A0AA89C036_PINIB|nr:hypothetical protein FSP39_024195 [Pinctada imbricata]
MAASKETRIQYCDLLTPVICDECDGQNDVINYCLQCHANICGECKSTHLETRLHRDHIVLPRTHSEVVKARRSKKIYCPAHIGKEFVTYCRKCKQPCCATCITEKHNGHKFCDLEKVISQTESDVDSLVKDMETKIIPLNEESISKLETHISLYKKSLDDVKISAEKKKLQHIEGIGKRYSAFLSDLEERGAKDLEKMDIKKKEIERNLGNVKSAITTGKKAAVDVSLLHVKDELAEVVAKSMNQNHVMCPGILFFCPSSFHLPSEHETIGTISHFYEEPISKLSIQEESRGAMKSDSDQSTMEAKVFIIIGGFYASSIIGTHDNMWIYNERRSEIDIYDEFFTRIKNIDINFYCSDMAFYGEDSVIAADRSACRIWLMTRSGSITHLPYIKLNCPCICVNDKHQIVAVVTDYDDNILEGEHCMYWNIFVCSFNDLSILQEIENTFSGVYVTQIRQTLNGEYIVAIDNRLVCLSREFESLWTYEFEDRKYAFLGGLHCDKFNNILVGDWHRNEIVLFNIDGQRVRTLLTEEDGICGPLSMDVDSKGRLWIGQRENVLIATYTT